MSFKENKESKRGGRWRWHASEGEGYCGDRTEVRERAGVSRDARRARHVRHVRGVSGGVRVIPKRGSCTGSARADLTISLLETASF